MLTLIALSAALLQTPAPPASPEVRTRIMVVGADGPGALDKDGDGHVSREEFSAPLDDHFTRLDKDGDGRLSTEELTAGHDDMAGGDHNITILRGSGGHEGPAVRRFELRRPHPGGEAGEGRTMVFVGGGPGAGGDREIFLHGGPGVHAMTAGSSGDGRPGERIIVRRMGGPGGENDLDADKDGRISEAEFLAPLREAFARMDADGSGFIESGERGSGHGPEVFVHRIEPRSGAED